MQYRMNAVVHLSKSKEQFETLKKQNEDGDRGDVVSTELTKYGMKGIFNKESDMLVSKAHKSPKKDVPFKHRKTKDGIKVKISKNASFYNTSKNKNSKKLELNDQ